MEDDVKLAEQKKELKEAEEKTKKLKDAMTTGLVARKKEIDAELESLGYIVKSSDTRKRAPKTCRLCGTVGHTARTCPQVKK